MTFTKSIRNQFSNQNTETIPPRTRLFNLTPYGLGTGATESLLSYLQRLAGAHCVSMRLLVADTIPELAVKDSKRLRPVPTFHKCRKQLAYSFNTATGRSDLQFLDVSDLFDLQQLYREERAWCPLCFKEDSTPYDRLAWYLRPVVACPIHRRHLVTTCSTCHSFQPVHFCSPLLDRCIVCGSSLIKKGGSSSPTAWEIFVAEQIADVLAKRGTKLIPTNVPGAIIDALIKKSGLPSDVAAARALGFQDNIVALWRRRVKHFKLATLCLFSFCFGPSVADLLWRRPSTWQISFRPLSLDTVGAVTPLIRNKSEAIANGLKTALKRSVSPSLRQVAKQLGTSPSTIHRNFPKEALMLIRLAKKAQKRRVQSKDAKLREQIWNLMDIQLKSGEWPTFQFIRDELSGPWEMSKIRAIFQELIEEI